MSFLRRVIFTPVALAATAIGSIIAGSDSKPASKNNLEIVSPLNKQNSFAAVKQPAVPSPFLVAMAEAAEPKAEAPGKEEKFYLITKRHIELAQADPKGIFAYELIKNPIIPLTDDLITYARKNKDTMVAMAVGMRLPKDRITQEDVTNSREQSGLPFYKGLLRNKNRPVEKEDIQRLKDGIKNNTNHNYNNKFFGVLIVTHMNDDIRKLVKDNILESSWIVWHACMNKNLPKDKTEAEFYSKHLVDFPDSWASDSLGENPSIPITDAMVLNALTCPNSPASRAILRRDNLPFNNLINAYSATNHTIRQARTKTPYYCELYEYSFTEGDRKVAQELYRSNFAYRVMIDPKTSPSKDEIDFALKDIDKARSGYAVAVFRNPIVTITPEIINRVTEKGMRDTLAAREVGRRLTYEQFRETTFRNEILRDAVWGTLCDSRFGESAIQNYFMAVIDPVSENPYFSNADKKKAEAIRFSLAGAALPLNPAFFSDETEKERAKGKFLSPQYQFNLGSSQNWGKITEQYQTFMIENPNHPLSIGLAGNINLEVTPKLRELAKKITKENPNSQFIYVLTKNPKFADGLTEKEREDELKFVFENKDSTYTGYLENSSTLITQPIKLFLRRPENSNSQAAVYAARNTNYIIDSTGDVGFVCGAGKDTRYAFELACRDDFPPEPLLAASKDSNRLRMAVRFFHPTFSITDGYVDKDSRR